MGTEITFGMVMVGVEQGVVIGVGGGSGGSWRVSDEVCRGAREHSGSIEGLCCCKITLSVYRCNQ